MATYYVSAYDGDDARTATQAQSISTPWKTPNKALTTLTPSGSGDTVFIAPGIYRSVVSVTITPTAASPVTVIGDVLRSQAWPAAVQAGEVLITAYTTDDVSAPSGSAVLTTNDKAYLTFRGLIFQNGSGYHTAVMGAGGHDLTFEDCAFFPGSNQQGCMAHDATAGAVSNVTFDRCVWVAGADEGLSISLPRHTAAYDVNVVVRNCLVLASGMTYSPITLFATGTGTDGGGVYVYNSTFWGKGPGVNAGGTGTYKLYVYGCFIVAMGEYGLKVQTAGTGTEITEDYNVILSRYPRFNVNEGTNSYPHATNRPAPTRAVAFSVGQERLVGRYSRHVLTPMADPGLWDNSGTLQGYRSVLLGFGNHTTYTSAVDLLNRPRPAGGESTSKAAGALERHDTARAETTTVDVAPSVVIVGPGDHEFDVPVDAAATTLSVKARYDATHGTTNKPQLLLLANAEIGVSAQTLTMTAAADTWETLTSSSFTPTAKGVVTLRLVSRAAAGGGKAFFDTAGT